MKINPLQHMPPLVLVADDDRPMRFLLRQAMEQEGYQVIEVSNGEQCLAAYAQFQPDIVLLDAVMPVMDGFSCCSRLQTHVPIVAESVATSAVTTLASVSPLTASVVNTLRLYRPPILMITGLDDPVSVDRAFEAGATDFVTKPIHWAVLRQRVRRLLQSHRIMTELHQRNERERLLGVITQQIRQSLRLEEILKTTVVEVRQFLQADRMVIYRLDPSGNGEVVAESTAPGWASILGSVVHRSWLENYIPPDEGGGIQIIRNTHPIEPLRHWMNLLQPQQIQAELAAPIWQADQKLWGLLVAHHSSEPHNWQPIEVDLLNQLTTQVAIAIQQANLYQQLEEANQELQRLAASDGLTQVANRRCFDTCLDKEWRRLRREQLPLSLILCDIDCFKAYNDTCGHQAGDDCLRQVAGAISRAVKRPADLVARYGGEEFAIILPNTHQSGAVHVALEIQEQIKTLAINHPASRTDPYITLSLGIATIVPDPQSSADNLIKMADQALYRAKAAGRNTYRVYSI